LSLPSLCLALLGSLGYFSQLLGPGPADRVKTQLLNGFSHAFSQERRPATGGGRPSTKIHAAGRADVVSIGFILALVGRLVGGWPRSSTRSRSAYGMRDLRGAVRSRLLALWLYLGSVVLGVVLLPALVLGRALCPTGSRRACARTPGW
jgi:membrane protein